MPDPVDAHKPVVVVGGGGHGRVVMDVLLASGHEVVGFVDRDPEVRPFLGIRRIGDDAVLLAEFSPEDVRLANGLGSVGVPGLRVTRFEEFRAAGFRFLRCIHPGAVIGRGVELGEGVQVMAGAVVQPGVAIGENTLVNTRASVDHDCRIGAHVHLAPGVTLSGGVIVGDKSHIGTGASVIQGLHIGTGCLVGAGSVVVHPVEDGAKVVGVPAKPR